MFFLEGAEFDDVEDDVLDLPGGPNEKVDIGRLLNRLGDIRGPFEKIIYRKCIYSMKVSFDLSRFFLNVKNNNAIDNDSINCVSNK